MNKRGIAPLILVLIGLIVVGGLVATGTLKLGSITGSGNYIERPVFKYIKCEALSEQKTSQSYSISENGGWLQRPSNTNMYSLVISIPDQGFFESKPRIEYYICNSKSFDEKGCTSWSIKKSVEFNGETRINDIQPDKYVWVQYQSFSGLSYKGRSGATYKISYVPYGLREYNFLGGSSKPINPNSCEVPSTADSWRDRLLGTDIDKVEDEVDKNVNQRVLHPEEVRWYVSGYLTSAAPSFALKYKNQDAWCRPTGQSAEIYKINTVYLGSGTYKVASADWNDMLGTETCCPGDKQGDKTCNSKFRWESTEKAECSSFNTCGGAEWTPYDSGRLIRYVCESGKCVKKYRGVECANNYDCKDSNQICDLNSYSCVEADVNLKGEKLETIPDSEIECTKKGGTWISKETKHKSFLNYLGIGEPDIITTEYCELNSSKGILYYVILVVIVGLLLLAAVFGFSYVRGLIALVFKR